MPNWKSMLASHFALLLVGILLAGCAETSNRLERQQTGQSDVGTTWHDEYLHSLHFLSASNVAPGFYYELGIYVIAGGDTFENVAQRFNVSVPQLVAVNPVVDPHRLYVGQRIRIYERKKE